MFGFLKNVVEDVVDSAQDERNRRGSSRDYHSGGRGGGGQQPGSNYKDVTDQITDELGTLRPNNPPQGYYGGAHDGQYGGGPQYGGQNQYGGSGQQEYYGGGHQRGGGADLVSGLIGGFLGGGGGGSGGGYGQGQQRNDGMSDLISGMASNYIGGMVSGRQGGGGGSGGIGNDLISGMASQYIGNLISGGGGGQSQRPQKTEDDVLSGIASSVIGGLVGGGGGGGSQPTQSGGAIASNIIGKIVRGAQFSRKEDGEIVENLSQTQVDPSKHRIFPDAGSLISSFMSKGAYHLRNRLFQGGRAREAFVSPAHAVFRFGERGSGLRPRGEIQDFYSLRQQCLDEGTLFEDPEFAAEDSSIFFSRSPPKPFEWKRPHEITDEPQLFIDGASRFDVKQGELGDCWLLAAVANLTLNKRLFYQIVPSDQGFGDNYAGIFHFRFWQYGRWVDVVIDDRLPTFYGRLVFMHSEERNEFWSALLEKAYAKLHGSYEALKGGTTCEAMEDFTGGVSEIYDLTKAPPNLFNIMLKAYERGSLMGCSIEPDPNVVEARCDTGLIRGHAYSVTRIKYCEINTPRVSGKIPLVRIRNPWGNEAEWQGSWSDQSPEWQFIPPEEKEEIGLTFEHDGEFWMSFKDFLRNFTMLELTNLNPDSLDDEDIAGAVKHKWEMSVFEGAWIRGSTAGGCRNFLATFWHNPQYRITLTEVDDDDDDNKCTVIVALMQKNRRSQRKLGLECLTIGFAIYHLRDPENAPRPLDLNFFKYSASVARSPSFINMREVSCRFKLPPGTYCIVPSTFEANEEGEFILRVFSEKANEMEENDESVGFGQVDERVRPEADESQEPEVDERIRGFFRKVAGEDLEIDWKELQDVLNFALKREFNFEGFSKDVCRSMIAMMDVDRSGKLGLQEFLQLWTDIRIWKNAFKLYDKDSSGLLCSFELRQALNSAGYRLNNHICNALTLRYGDKEGRISFDDFIMCSVKLKTMMGLEDDPEKLQEFYDELMAEVEDRPEEEDQEEDQEEE
ncbi:hypothetical protein OTU49_009721 [Cherax quadricarinatus]|uniref:Calpain-B n=1 Tax=Cherax quadricarinatus TaxID=27406 RepID=A0AAW0WHL2_CHEQU